MEHFLKVNSSFQTVVIATISNYKSLQIKQGAIRSDFYLPPVFTRKSSIFELLTSLTPMFETMIRKLDTIRRYLILFKTHLCVFVHEIDNNTWFMGSFKNHVDMARVGFFSKCLMSIDHVTTEALFSKIVQKGEGRVENVQKTVPAVYGYRAPFGYSYFSRELL